MEAASVDWGLTGKAVIVTGASSGIGASTARALGAAGASVLLVGRDVTKERDMRVRLATRRGWPHRSRWISAS